MTDLIERLRARTVTGKVNFEAMGYSRDAEPDPLTNEAADRIEELEAALEPFADIADYFDSETQGIEPDYDELVIAIDSETSGLVSITETRLRPFLHARTALNREKN